MSLPAQGWWPITDLAFATTDWSNGGSGGQAGATGRTVLSEGQDMSRSTHWSAHARVLLGRAPEVLALCLLLLLPAAASAQSSRDPGDDFGRFCRDSTSARCVSYCRRNLDKLPGAISRPCQRIIDDSQTAPLRKKACSDSSCIIRLARASKNLYRAQGYTVRVSDVESLATGGLGQTASIVGPDGRKGVFRTTCGASCSNVWDWVSGDFRRSGLTFVQGGRSLVLQVAR